MLKSTTRKVSWFVAAAMLTLTLVSVGGCATTASHKAARTTPDVSTENSITSDLVEEYKELHYIGG